jgi:hypothetical protein
MVPEKENIPLVLGIFFRGIEDFFGTFNPSWRGRLRRNAL